jgi:cell division protein FtsZ
MGIGIAEGDERAKEAADKAIRSPLLDISISGAKGVLIAVAGSDDLGILEVQRAIDSIKEAVSNPEAKIIFGVMKDEKLKKGFIRIIVIATGFVDKTIKDLDRSGPSLFSIGGGTKEKQEDKGQIFNTIMDRRREEESTITDSDDSGDSSEDDREEAVEDLHEVQERPSPHTRQLESDDDTWGAIPAFLRRKRK